jgi:hypothetical protein
VTRWQRFKDWLWCLATWRPAICCACKRIYDSRDFINPWWREPAQGAGKRMACSDECAEYASPGSTEGRV